MNTCNSKTNSCGNNTLLLLPSPELEHIHKQLHFPIKVIQRSPQNHKSRNNFLIQAPICMEGTESLFHASKQHCWRRNGSKDRGAFGKSPGLTTPTPKRSVLSGNAGNAALRGKGLYFDGIFCRPVLKYWARERGALFLLLLLLQPLL